MTSPLPVQGSRPNRFLAATAMVVGLAVVVSACSSVSSYAATVDGSRISSGTLETELRNLGSNDKFLKLAESQNQTPTRTNGVFDASFTSSVLYGEILYDLISDEMARRKLVVSPADLAAARASAVDRVGGEDVFNSFPKSYQDQLVHRSAEVSLLLFAFLDQGPPDVAAKAFYDANPDAFAQVCVSHILVATEDDANKVKGRLDAGEDFATVAREMSTDTGSKSSGGDLGCFGKQNQLVPEFAQAMFSQPVGVVGSPVKTQYGYHVILVKSRDVPPYDKVASEARRQAAAGAQDKFSSWLGGMLDKANITVNPKYGSFEKNGAQSRVVPPEAPTSKGSGAPSTVPDAGAGAPQDQTATTTPG